MSGQAKFCELAAGTCFDYRGRVYRKLRMNLAENEDRVRAMFPSDVEVVIVEMHMRNITHTGQEHVIRLNTAAKATAVEGTGPMSNAVGR